jgi:hypothetical protein
VGAGVQVCNRHYNTSDEEEEKNICTLLKKKEVK